MANYKYKLSLVIATKDRPYAIKKYIDDYSNPLLEHNTSITIVDGSVSNETEDIVSASKKKNIDYYHFPDFSITQRNFFGLKAANADYVCIAGDSKLPNLAMFDLLMQDLNHSYSAVFWYPLDVRGSGAKEYDDIESFFTDLGWQSILFSTMILRSADYDIPRFDDFCSLIGNNDFFMIYLYYACFAGSNFSAIYRPCSLCREGFKGKKVSYWLNHDDFYRLWFADLPFVLDHLPENLACHKQKFLFEEGTYGHKINTLEGLFKLKSFGCLEPDDVEAWYDMFVNYSCSLSKKQLTFISGMDQSLAKVIYSVLNIWSRAIARFKLMFK